MGQSIGGILLSTNEAAATLLVGVDAFRNERMQTDVRWRLVTALTMVGSTAINDCELDLFAGDTLLVHGFVTRIGAAIQVIIPEDLQEIPPTWVPPNMRISGVITNAPVANPLLCRVYGHKA